MLKNVFVIWDQCKYMSVSRFWIRTYPFLMATFPLKFMINGTILILILLISRFLMETSLDVHHMAFTYLSLFVSLIAKLLKQD